MKRNYLLGLVAVALISFTSAGWAADTPTDTRFYVAPMATWGSFNEDTANPDDQFGAQLSVGKTLTKHLAFELYGFHYNDVDTPNFGANANMDTWGVGVSALLFPARDIFPVFGIVGVGAGQYDFDQRSSGPGRLDSQDSDFIDVGVGVLIPITDYGVALRAEYRYRSADVDAVGGGEYQFRNNIVSVGLQIPLGAKPAPVVVAPAPAPVIAPPPEPVPVAPADGDNDGVLSDADQCPNTKANVNVDNKGCEMVALPRVLKGVHFRLGSADLTPDAKTRLNNVADALKKHPGIAVRVGGHTDSSGSAALNMRLSKQRADSVKRYLINHGVDASRLVTKGYGETRPIAPNTNPDGSDNPAGRALNRRVELHVVR